MLLTINSIAILIASFYLFQINIFRDGWRRLKTYDNLDTKANVNISVIVPFKNEKENLHKLFQSLQKQRYELFEVIFVDDNSNDESAEILERLIAGFSQYKLLKNKGIGKKHAIKTGVYHSENELIVTIDADVIFEENWLASIANCYQSDESDLIICPVKMSGGKRFVERFQQFEFVSLIGSGAGAAGAGIPILCSGANLAFKRESWLRSEKDLRFDIPSGDDMYLLQSIKKRKGKITFLKSNDAIVETFAKISWKDLFLQRSRWASKFSIYKDKSLLYTGFVVTAMSSIILLCFILFLFNPIYFYSFVLSFLMKFLVDVLFFNDIKAFFGLKKVLGMTFLFSFIYPLYIFATILMLPFREKKEW